MQFRTLLYFVELANAGSFYAASKNLGISQQGLSRTIGALEAELGTTLIDRDRRGIRLTSSGEIFLRHSKKLLDLHDCMIDELCANAQIEADLDNRIKVFVSYYSAQIAAIDPRYVKVLTKNSRYVEEPFEKLLKRAAASDGSDLVYLDVFPYSMEKIQADPDIIFRSTLKTRYGILWREGSALDGRDAIGCSEVSNYPVVVNAFRETAQYIEWLFRDSPLSNIRMGTTSPQMLIEYVRSSEDAIAVFDSFSFYLAKSCNPDLIAGLGFTPFTTPEALCEVGFVFPKKARLSMRAQYSVRLLSSLLQKNCSKYFEDYPND